MSTKSECKAALHSPLKNGYLIQNLAANWAFQVIDWFLRFWTWGHLKNFSIEPPCKVLLSNIAQLGDVILMTSLFPVLKEAFAQVEIGVIVGSWARQMVEGHPLVDHVHVIDHWQVARNSDSLWKKIRKTIQMSRQARREIKKVGYNVAVECNFHFPHTIGLTYRAKIPVRLGYTSGGFGPLLTHALDWSVRSQSVASYSLSLLQRFMLVKSSVLKPSLPSAAPFPHALPTHYVVIHMGAGHPMKEWPIAKWKELCGRLHRDGLFLVFTAKGEREAEMVKQVSEELVYFVDFSNRLSWEECIALVRRAKLLVSVDTGLGHVAAATDTPAVLLYTGIHPKKLWEPLGAQISVLRHQVSCSPCHRSNGCRDMSCIVEITVDEVDQAIKQMLAASTYKLEAFSQKETESKQSLASVSQNSPRSI